MEIETRHSGLLNAIKVILEDARQKATTAINSAMVFACWEIFKKIVQEEQEGKECVDYRTYSLKELAKSLSTDFGKSFDAKELRRIRLFYLTFQDSG